jgi:hypothetical protein
MDNSEKSKNTCGMWVLGLLLAIFALMLLLALAESFVLSLVVSVALFQLWS